MDRFVITASAVSARGSEIKSSCSCDNTIIEDDRIEVNETGSAGLSSSKICSEGIGKSPN